MGGACCAEGLDDEKKRRNFRPCADTTNEEPAMKHRESNIMRLVKK